MKRFILFFSAALVAGGLSLSAQEAKPQGLPEPPLQAAPSPEAAPEKQPAALDQTISLIPETLPNPSKKASSEEKEAKPKGKNSQNAKVDFSGDALKKRIRMRQVKNQALKDDRIQAQMDAAVAAKTDPEKRASLKRFYNSLFDRMIKIDGSLKPEVEQRRHTYLARYDQNRIRSAGESSEFDLENEQ